MPYVVTMIVCFSNDVYNKKEEKERERREIKRLLRPTCSEFTFLTSSPSLTSSYVWILIYANLITFSLLLLLLPVVLLCFPVVFFSFVPFLCFYANISTPVRFSYVTFYLPFILYSSPPHVLLRYTLHSLHFYYHSHEFTHSLDFLRLYATNTTPHHYPLRMIT